MWAVRGHTTRARAPCPHPMVCARMHLLTRSFLSSLSSPSLSPSHFPSPCPHPQVTNTEELERAAAAGRLSVYCGFDPTADSLHLGNLLGIVVLAWFQRWGCVGAGVELGRSWGGAGGSWGELGGSWGRSWAELGERVRSWRGGEGREKSGGGFVG